MQKVTRARTLVTLDPAMLPPCVSRRRRPSEELMTFPLTRVSMAMTECSPSGSPLLSP